MPIDKIKLPDNSTQDIHDKRVSGIDSTPTSGSGNLVTSGGVKTAVDAKQDTLVSGTNIKTVNGNSLLGSGNLSIDTSHLTEVTWSELKELRDNGDLIPGMQYRITDYVTTTVQESTTSAGHPFDIIVTADSEDTLNENARACLHEGDTYFSTAGAKLESWEIKYCLDNDLDRFGWITEDSPVYVDDIDEIKPSYDELPGIFKTFLEREQYDYEDQDCYFAKFRSYNNFKIYGFTQDDGASINDDYILLVPEDSNISSSDIITFQDTNGDYYPIIAGKINGGLCANCTGVIYYMKDEWGNECPYDFKNIQFKRYKITACQNSPSLVGQYSCSGISRITVNTSNPYWVYTFSMINLFDDVIDDLSVFQDKYPSDEGYCYKQENNIIKEYYHGDDDNGYLQYLPNNVFVTDTDLSYIEDDYSYGEFYGFSSNTFGNNCHSNTFGNGCDSNIFGDDCYSNTFGNLCHSNTFGNDCYSNIFGNYCQYNNTFGNYYHSNTFGDNCYSNTFGNYCYYNTFGNNCFNNIFGNNCHYNTFGNYCDTNTFGNGCYSIKTGNSSTTKSYYRYITVDLGNQNIYLYCSATTSGSKYYQNVRIHSGVNNTYTYKTITDSNVNQNFLTEYKPANSQTISV